MRFKQIGMNAVASDDGFVVRRKSRSELEYVENDRHVSIEVEPGDGLAVYVSGLECDNMDRIIRNVCAALNHMKVRYILE